MFPLNFRVSAALAAIVLLAGCKSGGTKSADAEARSGLFGRSAKKQELESLAAQEEQRKQQQVAANGLGNPTWPREVNNTIGQARQKMPTFQPASAPRRNPDVHVPVDPNRARSLTYSRVKVNGPFVAMTFDDGPHPTNTPRLLDILAKRNIKATFFVVGTNARRYPAIMKRMVAEGHEVGNHTVNHPHLTKITEAKAMEEVTGCEQAIVSTTGVKPRLFRPPGGYINNHQKIWLKDRFGYSTVMWAVDPQDWKRPGSSVVAQRIISNSSAGAIILAHDIHAPTITAMPQALDGLLAKGLRFVTVSQLIAMEQGGVAEAGGSKPAEATEGTVAEPTPLPGADPEVGTAEAEIE